MRSEYIFYLVFAGLYLFALYKERQALGCPNIPDGRDCDNSNGKAVKGTEPLPTDSTNIVAQKMKKAADFGDRWVMWRLSFLLSVPCIFLITYMLKGTYVPEPKELVVGSFVITALVYFTLNFYKFHLINHIRNNIDKGVDILVGRMA
jgi:hypothetical protein